MGDRNDFSGFKINPNETFINKYFFRNKIEFRPRYCHYCFVNYKIYDYSHNNRNCPRIRSDRFQN